MSSLAHAAPPMTAEEWSRVRRPLKRPYNGPPVLFRADPKKDPRIDSAVADVELEVRNWSARSKHPFLAWPTLVELKAVTGRSKQTVCDHIQTLVAHRRLISFTGIAELKQWLFTQGAKFGLSWEWFLRTVGRRKWSSTRFLIIVAKLPPIQDGYEWDSIFPLKGLKEPVEADGRPQSESSPLDSQRSGPPDPQESSPLDSQRSGPPDCDVAPLPISLTEGGSEIVVETEACEDRTGDDDGRVCSIPEWLQSDLALPQGHRKRAIAERMLQGLQARADGHQPNPTTRPAPEPLAVVPSPPKEAPRARLSDRVQGQVEAIVRAVASGATAPQDGGAAVGRAVQDCKPETIRTYAAGLAALADGRASLDDVLGLVADAFAPGMHSPNRRLSRFLSELSRRAKKPCAGSTRQSSPAHGPTRSLSASPHCTVAK